MNLLPKEYVQERTKRKKNRVLTCMLLVECIVFLVLMTSVKLQKYGLNKQLVSVNSQLEDDRFLGLREVEEEIKELEEMDEVWRGLFEEVEKGQMIGPNYLDEVIDNLPVGVMISEIELNNKSKTIKIQGFGVEPYAIMTYIERLQVLYGNKNVSFILQEVLQDQEYYSYSLEIVMSEEREENEWG